MYNGGGEEVAQSNSYQLQSIYFLMLYLVPHPNYMLMFTVPVKNMGSQSFRLPEPPGQEYVSTQ